jgi:hypothetical protein
LTGGIVSTSGYGDGGYVCYVAKYNKEIVAVKVIFIGNTVECEGCGKSIDEREYDENDGYCDECLNSDNDDDSEEDDFNPEQLKDMTEEELDDIIVNEILKLGKDEDEIIDTVQLKTCKVCGEVLTSLWEREDGVCKACQEEEEWN